MIRKTLVSFACLAAFVVSTAFAQESKVAQTPVKDVVETVKKEVTSVKIDKDGQLVGKAFTKIEGKETPLEARVTLSNNGVVIDSVKANEDGSFAFTNVEPGVYQMFGSADGYVGGNSFDVQPFSAGGCSTCNLGMQSNVGAAYDNFSAAPCSSCGGGIGGGGFGGGGGGLLGNRRLLRLGLIGGVVAIATGGDDASPAE
ncbi:MAG: carboxypeptidase-like regulatory domain-containing protein [Mariniblastus sp.]